MDPLAARISRIQQRIKTLEEQAALSKSNTATVRASMFEQRIAGLKIRLAVLQEEHAKNNAA